jgi:hypothetical protein
MQDQDRGTLEKYLAAVAAANPASWPRGEQLAFWINTYNAATVSAVLKGNSPEPAFGRVMLFKFWKFRAAGRERTLDEVEHEILRRQFTEPRIHFALVCASTSCPKLRREAYEAEHLEAQLEDQARQFINDPRRNLIDVQNKKLRLSEIFRWFREDFEKSAGSVPHFIARYVNDAPTRDWLLSPNVQVQHQEYDWTLNAQPNQRPPTSRIRPKAPISLCQLFVPRLSVWVFLSRNPTRGWFAATSKGRTFAELLRCRRPQASSGLSSEHLLEDGKCSCHRVR